MNAKMLEVVDALQADARRQPIIVIQSDHGPQVLDAKEQMDFHRARLRNLTAVYVPEGTAFVLPPDIAPVNLFRVILNSQFGDEMPILPDKHYFSGFSTPYDFQLLDLSERVESDRARQFDNNVTQSAGSSAR